MQQLLSNQTRALLGLKPIEQKWKLKQEKTDTYDNSWQDGLITYFYDANTLHKLIVNDNKQYKEYDASIPLNNELNMVSGRGKAKPLSLQNVENESHKEPQVKIDLTSKTALVECGVKWLPELPFQSVETIDADLLHWVQNSYGEDAWLKKVVELKKNPKIRQKYTDGDVFCVRVDANKYVYGLLIGSFMKLRKMDFWQSLNPGHFMRNLGMVPIAIRLYNFVSVRNDLSVEEVSTHELLNPMIVVDDKLLRGAYKIIGYKQLVESDILFPMHYSAYGKHKGAGYSTGWGLGVHEHRDSIKKRLSYLQPHYEYIQIVFNWGFGSVEIDSKSFISNAAADTDFIDNCSIGGLSVSFTEDGSLVNPPTIFSPEKVASIFSTMGVSCEPTFDAFNEKFGGFTAAQYIKMVGR